MEEIKEVVWEAGRSPTGSDVAGTPFNRGGRIGFFKGAQADTRSGQAMSPGTSARGGSRHEGGGGWSPGVGGTQHIPAPKPDPQPAPRKDVWNQYQLTKRGPFGGPFGHLGYTNQAFKDKNFVWENLIKGGKYLPGADLNKGYRQMMNEKMRSYGEDETIPMDKYKGLEIGRNYIPTGEDLLNVGPYTDTRYSIGDMKNIGLTDMQKELLDQRKGMLGALGSQGILDTITSEDDPNDPATLQDVKEYYDLAQGGLANLWPR